MRNVKRFGAALAVLVVLGVAVAATASAADPLFLKTGTLNGFSATGGAGTLSTLGSIFSITCGKVDASGTLGGNKTDTFTGTVTFTKCNANALAQNAEEIKFNVAGELCLINEAKLEVGLYLETTADVHLETILGLRVFLKGSSDVAALTPDGVKTKTLTAKLETTGTNGDQKVTTCTGLTVRKPQILVQSNETGSEADAAILTSFTITPAEEVTVDG
jgi:hypothetical protein